MTQFFFITGVKLFGSMASRQGCCQLQAVALQINYKEYAVLVAHRILWMSRNWL